MKLNKLAIAFALAAGAAGSASASSTGVSEFTTNFAFWDTFASSTPAFTITMADRAPNTFGDALFTADLDASMTGMITGSGERIYSGSGATANAFNLGIDGVATADISAVTLQLKFTGPLQNVSVNDNIIPAAGHFTISADPSWGSASQSYLGFSTEGTNTFYIYAWTWTGLDLSASDTFAIDITSDAGHVSLDAVRLDAAAIPEPSAFAALAGLGALGLVASRRRRA